MVFTFNSGTALSEKISSAMFGGNDLFETNLLSGPNGTFPAAAELLGITALRYPGGTMTEQDFDVTQPDSPPVSKAPGVPFVGITEFLNFAGSSDLPVTIVLPTSKLYTGSLEANNNSPRSISEAYLKDLVKYVTELLTHGDTGPGALAVEGECNPGFLRSRFSSSLAGR